MKRMIYADSEREEINLTDLFSRIVKIVVVDDARSYQDNSIYASSVINYNEYSDDELLNLDDEEIHNIEDVTVMQRISKLNPNRLTSIQKRLVKNSYDVKVVIDKTDVENIISDLRACNRIRVEDTRKNIEFDEYFNLSDSAKLSIIHRLTISDFVHLTSSYTHGHEGNRLIVFMPEVTLTSVDNFVFTDVYLYVKIDLSTLTSNGGVIAVVSFHTAQHIDSIRPYRETNNEDQLNSDGDSEGN